MINVSSNIVFFSKSVTIEIHAVTRHDITNLRRVSKIVTHTIHFQDAERPLTVTETSVHLENKFFSPKMYIKEFYEEKFYVKLLNLSCKMSLHTLMQI
jgi:hypothetical protein